LQEVGLCTRIFSDTMQRLTLEVKFCDNRLRRGESESRKWTAAAPSAKFLKIFWKMQECKAGPTHDTNSSISVAPGV